MDDIVTTRVLQLTIIPRETAKKKGGTFGNNGDS